MDELISWNTSKFVFNSFSHCKSDYLWFMGRRLLGNDYKKLCQRDSSFSTYAKFLKK